ncbi:MAG: pentapeptide repeat-containing protein [Methylococcaceae bacterium]|jgi:uncharacterized protein YjbI with pentapeptide repeats
MKPDRRWGNIHQATKATLVEIKHRDTGAVIFSRDVESNTVAKTLRIAIILKIDIRHADLSGQDLTNTYFDGADFSYCNMAAANLSGASFRNARFDHASMNRVIAHHGNFEKALFNQAFMQKSSFVGANLNNVLSMEGDWRYADCTNADMRGFGTRGAQLKGMILDGTLLDGDDTRLGYRAPRHKVPCVCDGPCQNCIGCDVPKKYETFGELASPGKTRSF